MKKIPLGRTGHDVSVIGHGCAGMTHSYGPADREESLATLRAALDAGVELFDTADAYGGGGNERLVGEFLRGVGRERALVATKFGFITGAERRIENSPAWIAAACDASLERLGVETIDLYYMHRRNPDVPLEDSVGAMARLVEAGKVRWLGMSEVSPETLRRAHAIHPITALQSEYSLFTRDPEGPVLDTCRALGVTFVCFGPLGRAFLTGAVDTKELAPNDFRRRLPRFQDDVAARNAALVEHLRLFAQARGVTPAQIALAWLIAQNRDGQSVLPIPGTKRRKYLAENVHATEIELSPAELAELEKMFPPGIAEGSRYTAEDARQVGT